jgi:hypothetical protein
MVLLLATAVTLLEVAAAVSLLMVGATLSEVVLSIVGVASPVAVAAVVASSCYLFLSFGFAFDVLFGALWFCSLYSLVPSPT